MLMYQHQCFVYLLTKSLTLVIRNLLVSCNLKIKLWKYNKVRIASHLQKDNKDQMKYS